MNRSFLPLVSYLRVPVSKNFPEIFLVAKWSTDRDGMSPSRCVIGLKKNGKDWDRNKYVQTIGMVHVPPKGQNRGERPQRPGQTHADLIRNPKPASASFAFPILLYGVLNKRNTNSL